MSGLARDLAADVDRLAAQVAYLTEWDAAKDERLVVLERQVSELQLDVENVRHELGMHQRRAERRA